MSIRYKNLATIHNIVTDDIETPADAVWINSDLFVIACHRCGGSTHLPHYDHIASGQCFACIDQPGVSWKGTPEDWVDMIATRRLETIKQDQKAQQKHEFLERRFTKLVAQRPELEGLREFEDIEDDEFLINIRSVILHKTKKPTEAQIDAAVNALADLKRRRDERAARQQAREDARRPAPTGKGITVTGVVKSVKEESDPYSYQRCTITKFRIEVPTDDGGCYTVWSKVPAALHRVDQYGNDTGRIIRSNPDLSGATVQFKAELICPGDDPSFAIAKRPGGSTKKHEIRFWDATSKD